MGGAFKLLTTFLPQHLQAPIEMSNRRRGASSGGSTHIYLARRVFARGEEAGLRLAFKPLGWVETKQPASADIVWDVWLNDAEVDQHATLVPGQLLNRFPAMADCCRKAVFATLLARLRRLLPPTAPLNDGRYLPVQFSLPHQKDALREHVERRSALAQQDPSARQVRPYYIVKPDSGSQGEGIKITADPERCKPGAPGQERVVQEYIARPMLLEGLKFDLRLYVLVADIQDDDDDPRPMRLFLCREGLARFAVDPYESPSSDNVSNVHMHLTNYSLNRKADGFKVCEDPDGGYGSKRTVSSVLRALMRVGKISDPEEVWQQLESLVGRSLGVIQPVLAASRARWSNPCFQILGFDVLLDADGHPWLIEINDHPSIRIDAQLGCGALAPSQLAPSKLGCSALVQQLSGSAAVSAASSHAAYAPPLPMTARPGTARPGTAPPGTARRARSAGVLVPSAVDETIKVPMVRDALRIVAALHRLSTDDRHLSDEETSCSTAALTAPSLEGFSVPQLPQQSLATQPDAADAAPLPMPAPLPPPAASLPPPPPRPSASPERKHPAFTRGAFGTCYVEIATDPSEARHLQLLGRLRDLFEQHTPSADLFDATWGAVRVADVRETSSSGPRWRSATWSRFLKATGLAGGHRASAVAAGLAGLDADLLFTSVCGKGGTMDLLDFAEALARVAARIYPTTKESSSPAELVETLLSRSFSGGHSACVGPASARATTAARAQSVARAAASARAAGEVHHGLSPVATHRAARAATSHASAQSTSHPHLRTFERAASLGPRPTLTESGGVNTQ